MGSVAYEQTPPGYEQATKNKKSEIFDLRYSTCIPIFIAFRNRLNGWYIDMRIRPSLILQKIIYICQKEAHFSFECVTKIFFVNFEIPRLVETNRYVRLPKRVYANLSTIICQSCAVLVENSNFIDEIECGDYFELTPTSAYNSIVTIRAHNPARKRDCQTAS